MLSPPNKGKKDREEKKDVHPIKVNVVMAYNEEHEWVLITKLPIDTLWSVDILSPNSHVTRFISCILDPVNKSRDVSF